MEPRRGIFLQNFLIGLALKGQVAQNMVSFFFLSNIFTSFHRPELVLQRYTVHVHKQNIGSYFPTLEGKGGSGGC